MDGSPTPVTRITRQLTPVGEERTVGDDRATDTSCGRRRRARRTIGLSVDVDSVAAHLEAHGFERAPDAGTAYRVAVPRALDLLDRYEARATFFLIASEARNHRDVVREIVDRGHEIGSHSLTHSLPFGGRDGDGLDREVRGSRFILQTLSGSRVHGFRPPEATVPRETRSVVARAGYRYLAAAHPYATRGLLRSLLRRGRSGLGRRTVTRSGAADDLTEIPVTSLPGVPVTYCNATRLLLPDLLFRVLRRAFLGTSRLHTYQLHAVDFLDVRQDHLHPAIECHPGMGLSLDRKLELAAEELGRLSGDGRIVPLQALAGEQVAATAEVPVRAAAGARSAGTRTRGLAVAPTQGTLHWT